MAQEPSSEPRPRPINFPPPMGAPGSTYTPLIEARTRNPHGLRGLAAGFAVLAGLFVVLFILGRVAAPWNLVLAGVVVAALLAGTLLSRRNNR